MQRNLDLRDKTIRRLVSWTVRPAVHTQSMTGVAVLVRGLPRFWLHVICDPGILPMTLAAEPALQSDSSSLPRDRVTYTLRDLKLAGTMCVWLGLPGICSGKKETSFSLFCRRRNTILISSSNPEEVQICDL